VPYIASSRTSNNASTSLHLGAEHPNILRRAGRSSATLVYPASLQTVQTPWHGHSPYADPLAQATRLSDGALPNDEHLREDFAKNATVDTREGRAD